jgi:alpha-D-xyloside xylohydrolase
MKFEIRSHPFVLFPALCRHARVLSALVCLLLNSVNLLCAGELNSPKPQVQSIAPGIWRIRFGKPEEFTSTHFRSARMDTAGLDNLPGGQNPPVVPDQISCRISDRGCSVLLPMTSDESIYGLGLSTELFDMARTSNGPGGRTVYLKPTDSPENKLGESHAPAPFFASSRGYGVFVDTARFATFYTGNVAPVGAHSKTMLIDVPAARGLDIYIFAGPAMLDAVERYNLFSGGGALPPLWGLGIQYRGYRRFGADESLALAARIRAEHIPCDVWGVEPGWQSASYSCSFAWDSGRFPDPDTFLQKMRGMNYRMNFWEHAFTSHASPIFDELRPWSGNFLVWNGLVPDFASPQARKIFLKQNNVSLFDRKVDAVKLDECDYQPESAEPWSFPLASAFPSGLDGEQMHSLFGLLYQQTMLKPYQEKGLRTWGLVRNSYALAASLPYVLYSDSYNPHCYVRGVANQGFSGLLWTPEVRDADSIEDLYRRIETVIFSSDAVINSWYIKNPPWDQINRDKNNNGELMPDRQGVTDTVRKLLQLRMSFIPYLYTAFNEYHSTGKPPIRAMVLDWPDDPNVREIDDQFMFGDSVLVAPMFTGEPSRQVYLPSGDWYNCWTHARISGGKTIVVSNPNDQIPLFVKSNTLLPLADPVEFIKPDTCFNITINIFGDKPAAFTLYEDDGITSAYAKGAQNQVELDASSHTIRRNGDYHGPPRYQVTAWRQY